MAFRFTSITQIAAGAVLAAGPMLVIDEIVLQRTPALNGDGSR